MASKLSSGESDIDDCEKKLSALLQLTTISDEKDGNLLNVNDDLAGNLSKFIACPPDCKDSLKTGHLMFHACFQSGNLGRVDWVSDLEYDLFIRPDTCNPKFRVWFNFTVQNVRSGQRVIFNIVNFSKNKSLYREGMTPVVKSTTRPKWQRISPKNVFYYRSPDHHKNYVMSFAFAFDRESDVYQFAYCYPYTYNKLQKFLGDIERLDLNYVDRRQICLSVQQKQIDLLTITAPKNQRENTKCKVVFFTARVHPGETPSSFVCHGIISFLISEHPIAQVLRDHIVFMIVPMLNPDGVVLGNYRSSLMGFDLNRFWNEPSPWAHPSIVATKQLLLDMDEDQQTSLDFYIDLHAHSTAMSGFMYGNFYDEEDRLEQHSVFPRLLSTNAEDFSYSSTSFNQDAFKAGTGRRTFGTCLSEQTNSYTLEVSFYCYTNKSSTIIPYSEDGYIKLGNKVAKTFLDYYKLNSQLSKKINKINTNSDRLTARKRNTSGRRKSSLSDREFTNSEGSFYCNNTNINAGSLARFHFTHISKKI